MAHVREPCEIVPIKQWFLTRAVHGELKILNVSKPSKDFVQMGLRYILGQFLHDDLID